MRFNHPEPVRHNPRIYPVFIPFAGCRTRCVFCAQTIQTGQGQDSAQNIIRRVEERFAGEDAQNPVDLAYYGGTFTAMPEEDQREFMALAARLKNRGVIRQVRCSTRPDSVTLNQLGKLRESGLDCVELGVQSFCSGPLSSSLRGYSGLEAYKACQMVLESGLRLGIQLMPGLPGQTPRHFEEDIKVCLEVKPDMARLYPCLVIRGTVLAARWEHGAYTPWSLEETLDLLPPAILSLWEHGIRPIRLGLAPENGLEENILAGPYHKALGQRLRSRALHIFIKNLLTCGGKEQGLPPGKKLMAPRRAQGEFFGHGGELKSAYAATGVTPANVGWWEHEHFEVIDEA